MSSLLSVLFFFFSCLCLFPFLSSAASSSYSHLHCSLCISALDEIEYAVEQTKEEYDVQTKWRVDDKRKIPYKRTEFRIIEIMEKEVLPKLEKYGLCVAVEEKNGKTVKRYCREDWRFGNYSKLSKALESDVKQRYEHLIEEYMEDITLLFHRAKSIEEIKQNICVDTTKICRRLPEYSKTSTAAPNPNPPPPFQEPKEENATQTQIAGETQAQTVATGENGGESNVEAKKDEL